MNNVVTVSGGPLYHLALNYCEFQENVGDHSLDFVHVYCLDNHHRA